MLTQLYDHQRSRNFQTGRTTNQTFSNQSDYRSKIREATENSEKLTVYRVNYMITIERNREPI